MPRSCLLLLQASQELILRTYAMRELSWLPEVTKKASIFVPLNWQLKESLQELRNLCLKMKSKEEQLLTTSVATLSPGGFLNTLLHF